MLSGELPHASSPLPVQLAPFCPHTHAERDPSLLVPLTACADSADRPRFPVTLQRHH